MIFLGTKFLLCYCHLVAHFRINFTPPTDVSVDNNLMSMSNDWIFKSNQIDTFQNLDDK